jgi:hypothetical protein
MAQAYSFAATRKRRDLRPLLIALGLAVAIHVLPMIYMVMPATVFPPEEPASVSMDLADLSVPESEPNSSASDQKSSPPAAAALPKVPESVIPVVPPPPAPPIAAPKLPAPEMKTKDTVESAPTKLERTARPEMNSNDMAAFDQSSVITKEPPKNAYASDRNSTAADMGPKNLPRGDPYVKDGESAILRDLGRRGEGDLPPVASSPNSGTVKVEGSPDAGKGLDDPKRPADRMPPKLAPPEDGDISTASKPAVQKDVSAAKTAEVPQPAAKLKAEGLAKTEDGSLPVGETRVKGPDRPSEAPKKGPDQPVIAKATPESKDSNPAKPDEVELWKAQFDAKMSSAAGKGGETGDKKGIHARPGEKGHEGDGTLRPGDAEATSDIVTFNIDSSAEEVGQPRFAKRLDPIAAYFKPIKRRTDNKWKSQLIAKNRTRAVVGSVAMRVVVDKHGKLVEAKETERAEGVPDEYVTLCKEAIERACDPAADPFPPALSGYEKVEVYFVFFYHQ